MTQRLFWYLITCADTSSKKTKQHQIRNHKSKALLLNSDSRCLLALQSQLPVIGSQHHTQPSPENPGRHEPGCTRSQLSWPASLTPVKKTLAEVVVMQGIAFPSALKMRTRGGCLLEPSGWSSAPFIVRQVLPSQDGSRDSK